MKNMTAYIGANHGKLLTVLCWWLLGSSVGILKAQDIAWESVSLPPATEFKPGLYRNQPQFHKDIGWIVTGQRLCVTRDQGRTWSVSIDMPAPNGRLNDAYFIDSERGWACAVDPGPDGLAPDTSLLLRTPDGGENWETVIPMLESPRWETEFRGAGAELTSVYFRDANVGIGVFIMVKLIVEGSIVARTEDGGETWRELDAPWPGNRLLISAGSNVWRYTHTSILHTPDYGNSFSEYPLPPMPSNGSRSILMPDFLSSGYGWTLGSYLYSDLSREWKLLRSSDAGRTWTELELPFLSALSEFGQSPSSCLIDETRGAILIGIEDEVQLRLTDDGGETWRSFDTPIANDQYDVACNRHTREVWLVPRYDLAGQSVLFRGSLPTTTLIAPTASKQTTWGNVKSDN